MTTDQITAALTEEMETAKRALRLSREWIQIDRAIYVRKRAEAHGQARAIIGIATKLGLPEIADEARKILAS